MTAGTPTITVRSRSPGRARESRGVLFEGSTSWSGGAKQIAGASISTCGTAGRSRPPDTPRFSADRRSASYYWTGRLRNVAALRDCFRSSGASGPALSASRRANRQLPHHAHQPLCPWRHTVRPSAAGHRRYSPVRYHEAGAGAYCVGLDRVDGGWSTGCSFWIDVRDSLQLLVWSNLLTAGADSAL